MPHQTADHARLPFYLLLCWIVLLPWPLGANRDWIWPWFSSALFAIAALAAWKTDLPAHWRVTHPALRWALICLAMLAIVDVLRVLFASPGEAAWWRVADAQAATLGALRSTTLCALVYTLMLLISSRRRARWLMASVFVCGVVQALLALTITLGGLKLHWLGHTLGVSEFATGTFINRNHFAGMLELAGAAGFGLLASGLHATEPADDWREWLRRVVHALLGSRFAVRAGLAILIVALVMTRSRMGNAGFFAGLTVAGIAALVWWRPLPRILIWLLVSIVAVDLLVLGAWVGVDKLAERVAETRLMATTVEPPTEDAGPALAPQTTQAPLEPDDAERWIVASAGLRVWRQQIWLGHGPGSFGLLFPAVKPESVRLFYQHAHNDYVQSLVERGLIGFGLQLMASLALLWAALQALRRRHDSLARGMALASIVAATAFGLHSFVDFNLQIAANQFWFQLCLMLGALAHALPVPRPMESHGSGAASHAHA
jgi:putative inorganic carbon (HCO3(-)) transporter